MTQYSIHPDVLGLSFCTPVVRFTQFITEEILPVLVRATVDTRRPHQLCTTHKRFVKQTSPLPKHEKYFTMCSHAVTKGVLPPRSQCKCEVSVVPCRLCMLCGYNFFQYLQYYLMHSIQYVPRRIHSTQWNKYVYALR